MSEKARMNTCNAREAAPVPVTPWDMMFLHGKHFLFLSVLLYNDRFVRKATSKDTGEEMHRERFGEEQAATFSGHCQLQLTSTWSTLSEMSNIILTFYFVIWFCVWASEVCCATTPTRKSEGNSAESVLSFHLSTGSGNQTCVTGIAQ